MLDEKSRGWDFLVLGVAWKAWPCGRSKTAARPASSRAWRRSAPAAGYEVSPWGLELAGGLTNRLRNGDSWGGRADGYACFCGDETQFVLAKAYCAGMP